MSNVFSVQDRGLSNLGTRIALTIDIASTYFLLGFNVALEYKCKHPKPKYLECGNYSMQTSFLRNILN